MIVLVLIIFITFLIEVFYQYLFLLAQVHSHPVLSIKQVLRIKYFHFYNYWFHFGQVFIAIVINFDLFDFEEKFHLRSNLFLTNYCILDDYLVISFIKRDRCVLSLWLLFDFNHLFHQIQLHPIQNSLLILNLRLFQCRCYYFYLIIMSFLNFTLLLSSMLKSFNVLKLVNTISG